jgi:hypothetical protein
MAPNTTLGAQAHCLAQVLKVARKAPSQFPYLPEHEADRIHYRGLDDLPPREDAPCDGVGLQFRSIGDVLTLKGGEGRGRGRSGRVTCSLSVPGDSQVNSQAASTALPGQHL